MTAVLSEAPNRLTELVVDLTDPFFFDHALDHIPGMLLFNALLDAAWQSEADSAEAAGVSPPGLAGRLRADVRFTKICELDLPTTLGVAAGGDSWRTAATQSDHVVCTADFDFVHAAPQVYSLGQIVGTEPAVADLVHRHRDANILVGRTHRDADGLCQALLLSAPAGHPLHSTDPDYRTPVEIVEAARQFVISLEHTEYGIAIDTQMLWLSVVMDIPLRIPRSVPITLRHTHREGEGRRATCGMTLVEAVTGAELGTLTFSLCNLSPSRYAQMRGAS
ncbi:AfsA-related hotdog domain-containing protein [Streptomyces sp. NPDC014344]|uniref:AfsA-related hotdog domain-containing protein n=1 Tax=Streptomyces sp. NPDC014344 TaxID=3364871 RepID=UPI0036FFDE7A